MKLYIKDSKIEGRYYYFSGLLTSYLRMFIMRGKPDVSYISEEEFNIMFGSTRLEYSIKHKVFDNVKVSWGAYQEGQGLIENMISFD